MSDTVLGWASLLVAAVSIARWVRAIRRVEIPKNRIGFGATWVAAAALGLSALSGEPGWLGGIPAGLGTFASCFLLFTIAIGNQKVAADGIQVGAQIPAFTALDEHGESFDSASLAGHPTLIKFFRGHW